MSVFHKIRKYSRRCFQFLIFISLFTFSLSAVSNDHRFNSKNPISTYLGGNNNEAAYAIALDSKHNIFIAGETNSTAFDSFPISQDKYQFNQNCFVIKISASSPNEDFYFEFSGSKRETCRDIAIDKNDNIYLTGETQSNDLPVTTNKTFGGEWDAFLLKLSNKGEILYASYLGGNLTDYGHGLAIESVDNVYITGETWSTNFPTTDNAFMPDCKPFTGCNEDKNKSKANIFLTHINTQKPKVFNTKYSTYLGGNNNDKAHDLAIDKNKHLHIVGETRSHDFPLVGKLTGDKSTINNQSLNGTYDAFLAVINPHISNTINDINIPPSKSLVLSTYIGGSRDDFAFSVTTDDTNTSYIAGETWSDDFPTTNDAFSKKCGTGIIRCNQNNAFKNHSDAFIIAISHDQLNHNNTTSVIKYATYIGGENTDTAKDIFIDGRLIYVTGTTTSNKFPITDNAIKPICHPLNKCDDANDGFIIAIDTNFSAKKSLIYSSYIGGSNKDNINSFSFSVKNTTVKNKSNIDDWPSTNFSSILMTGQTYSVDFIENGKPQDFLSSFDDAVDIKIENGESFIQEINMNRKGQWIDQYPIAKPLTNKRQVMASFIGYSFFMYVSLAIFFRIIRKTS